MPCTGDGELTFTWVTFPQTASSSQGRERANVRRVGDSRLQADTVQLCGFKYLLCVLRAYIKVKPLTQEPHSPYWFRIRS